MAYMAIVIGGDAADIEFDVIFFQGRKGRLAAAFCVVYGNSHQEYQILEQAVL